MTAKKTVPADATGSAPGFEAALARLETIVSDMEDGALTLDDMIKRFEEGQGLVRLCTTKLNEIEKKVELLVKNGDTVTTAPLDVSAADESPADDDRPPADELF